LGDTIFTLPALGGLVKNYYDYNFFILCSETNKILYELKFNNLKYIVINREEIGLEKKSFTLKYFKICYQVRRLAPKITVDLTAGLKSSIIAFFSGAEQVVGFGNKKLKSFFDVYEIKTDELNMTEMFSNPVRKLIGKNPNLPKGDNSQNKKEIKRILITPFAGWKAKEWGLRKYLQLGVLLGEKYDVMIVSEKNKIPLDVIISIKNSSIKYKTTNSLLELIEEIKNCDLFIGNDSGPLYISNILHKPVFAIFGPTNPMFHTPVINEKYSFISNTMPCSPDDTQKMCFTFGGRKGCPAYECMNRLSTKKVYSSVINFITDLSL
jgi:ADP-heptose:LPS heptosyltransferase